LYIRISSLRKGESGRRRALAPQIRKLTLSRVNGKRTLVTHGEKQHVAQLQGHLPFMKLSRVHEICMAWVDYVPRYLGGEEGAARAGVPLPL
jgi:hypothetical protein